jgi:hypothetical protein
MDAGDFVAIAEGVLLAGTWTWVLRAKRTRTGWREYSALWSLICASVAILSDIVLTVVMHYRGETTLAAILFLTALVASLLLGLAGIVLGILGRGTPRVAGLLWSCVTLCSIAASVLLAVMGYSQA